MESKVLKTKVEIRRIPLDASQAEIDRLEHEWQLEDFRKLKLLCDELGIPDGPERFYTLALELARRLYPGFQEIAPKGKWSTLRLAYLVVEIERLTGKLGISASATAKHSAKSAAAVLAKRPEWLAVLGANRTDPGEALRVQYASFKDEKWASVMRDAFETYEINNALAKWQLDMADALKMNAP
jgi:hypothetical protein